MEFTLPDSVPLSSRSGHAFRRNAARLACVAAMQLGLMACAEQSEHDVAQVVCTDGVIGTFRTIELTQNSAELWQKLDAKEVVLTFDDGPHRSRTPEVLDVLAEHCVKATFFLRGDQAADHPKLVRRLTVAGHVVGAHGWAHGALLEMTPDEARADIEKSVVAITDALAASPATENVKVDLFRYPYTASSPELDEIVRELGLVPVTVHADGADWELSDPEAIVARVFEGLERSGDRGAILLHDPFKTSAAATRLLLTRLNEAGYRIVALHGGLG